MLKPPLGLIEPRCLAACTSDFVSPPRRQHLQGAASNNMKSTQNMCMHYSVHLQMIGLHDERIIFRHIVHGASAKNGIASCMNCKDECKIL